MNSLLAVNSVRAPVDDYVSKAWICAAIACAVIYAPLCVFLLAIGVPIERVFVGGLGGCSFWAVVWIIGAVFIEKTERRTASVIATGLVYGAITGLSSGFVLTAWPYCSQPTDPTPQTIGMGIGAPAILLPAISFGILGAENNSALGLFFSATFWAMFGFILAMISRLTRLKTQRRLASE
jgi:hypothetical protein